MVLISIVSFIFKFKQTSQCAPHLFLLRGGGVGAGERLNLLPNFQKREGLAGSQFSDLKISEGGCWERGGGIFQRGLQFLHKKVYKEKVFLSVTIKNLNWEILTKSLITFRRRKDGMGLRMKNFNIMWVY